MKELRDLVKANPEAFKNLRTAQLKTQRVRLKHMLFINRTSEPYHLVLPVCGAHKQGMLLTHRLDKVTCLKCRQKLMEMRQAATYQEALGMLPSVDMPPEQRRAFGISEGADIRLHMVGTPAIYWGNMVDLRLVEVPEDMANNEDLEALNEVSVEYIEDDVDE